MKQYFILISLVLICSGCTSMYKRLYLDENMIVEYYDLDSNVDIDTFESDAKACISKTITAYGTGYGDHIADISLKEIQKDNIFWKQGSSEIEKWKKETADFVNKEPESFKTRDILDCLKPYNDINNFGFNVEENNAKNRQIRIEAQKETDELTGWGNSDSGAWANNLGAVLQGVAAAVQGANSLNVINNSAGRASGYTSSQRPSSSYSGGTQSSMESGADCCATNSCKEVTCGSGHGNYSHPPPTKLNCYAGNGRYRC